MTSGNGREALLRINLREVATDPELDLKAVADRLDGYSGADITNVCRSANVCDANSGSYEKRWIQLS